MQRSRYFLSDNPFLGILSIDCLLSQITRCAWGFVTIIAKIQSPHKATADHFSQRLTFLNVILIEVQSGH